MSFFDIVNQLNQTTDEELLALFKLGAEARKAELRKNSALQLAKIGMKLEEDIFELEKKVKAGEVKQLELDKLKVQKQEVLEVIAEKGAFPPTTEQAQSAELIPEGPPDLGDRQEPGASAPVDAQTIATTPIAPTEQEVATAVGTTISESAETTAQQTTEVITEENVEEEALEEFQEELEREFAQIKYLDANVEKNSILNASTYDLSKLRFVGNIKKYLEDPLAFMTNNVWNYNLPSTKNLRFGYRFPNSVMVEINQVTEQLIDESYKTVNLTHDQVITKLATGEDGNINLEIYNSLTDLYFIKEFSAGVRKYLSKKFSGSDLSTLEIEIKNIYEEKNLAFFWFWWNQLLAKNSFMVDNDARAEGRSILKIVANKQSYIPLSAALYFLEVYYGAIDRSVTDININKLYVNELVPNKIKSNLSLSKGLFNYISTLVESNTTFVNTNNYLNFKNAPGVDFATIVQVKGSPFFNQSDATLSPSEQKRVTTQKTVNRCKNVKSEKKETSLNLFYKEGNDNILDKDPPSPGLGCSSGLQEWSTADDIIFDGGSLLATNQRVNFTLPYYNALKIIGKDLLPDETNIYKLHLENIKNPTVLQKTIDNFRTFTTKVLLFLTGKNEAEVLIDNDLVSDLATLPTSAKKLEASFFNRFSKGWGAAIAIDRNKKFDVNNPNLEVAYSPYVGAFPLGYKVSKTNLADEVLQNFYVNLLGSNQIFPDYFENVLDLFDSQIKYGTGYKYQLANLFSFSELHYQYDSFETEEAVQVDLSAQFVSKKGQLKKLEEKLKEVENQEITGNPIVKQQKKFQQQLEIASLKIQISATKLVLAELETALKENSDPLLEGASATFVFFKVGDVNYFNNIEEVEVGEITNPLSYVDLPPTPLFMQVYPKRGINDKIILTFKGYSLENKVQTVEVPRNLWTEGWQDARQFFINSFKDFPKSTLDSLGIKPETVGNNDVFFAEQPVEKIRLYFTQGEKPSSLLEMEQFGEDINVITEGFTTEIPLQANTKYYFAAKAVNFTGLMSEFSQVYEIELVDDGGAVFALVNVVELEKEVVRPTKLNFGKKFRIQPALLQQAPNIQKNDIGYLTPSVFSPPSETKTQFKVRLTSKKTGRKVDFNIIYKKDFVKNNDEKAGDISLENAKKENVLISYDAGLLDNLATTQLDIALEDNAANLVNVASDTPTKPAPKLEIPSEDTKCGLTTITRPAPDFTAALKAKAELRDAFACCAFDNKKRLFPDDYNPNEPFPPLLDRKKLDLNPNVKQRQLNEKILELNKAIGVETKDPQLAVEVVSSMSLEEKCYLCKRKPEYRDGLTTLGLMEQRYAECDFEDVLNVLDCQQFGFASSKGGISTGNTGENLNTGDSLAKCNTSTVIRKKYVPGTGEVVSLSKKDPKTGKIIAGQQKVSLGGGSFETE
jgi:hypothetical protein